jgi:peptide/nickel transport system substrate-binding protein
MIGVHISCRFDGAPADAVNVAGFDFSSKRSQHDAGMRIEPRPSRPCAVGMIPAAIVLCPLAAMADTVLTWGKPAEITGFSVHVAGTVASWEMYEMVYETLRRRTKALASRLGLVEAWEQTSPTSYTLTLPEGAAFSNGRAVAPGDAIGGLEPIKNPDMVSHWSPHSSDVASLVAYGDWTIRVGLAVPQAMFLPALSHITAAILPMTELRAGSFDPAVQMLVLGPLHGDRAQAG